MTPDAQTIGLTILDIVGVFAFALAGGLAGVRKGFDIFGVLVLAGACGLGGGVLRDLLIGATPPVGISDCTLILSALIAGFVAFLLPTGVERSRRPLLVIDAFGLGSFAIAGTLKGLQFGVPVHTAIIVGTLTGVGGGLIRDLLTDQVPALLADRDLYAVPALAGAAVFATLYSAGVQGPVVAISSALLITGFRLVALRRRWQVPVSRG